ncbi:MFS transporter [Novacetimonas pomaceti]|uniref:MFS transporter n=1 Tax=Novacetimonas pomaceti TaxID=2021998 RepID=UPI0030B8F533
MPKQDRYPTSGLCGLIAIAVFAGLANASLLCAPVIATQLMTELGLDARKVGLFFSMEFGGYCLAGLGGRWLLPGMPWRLIVLVSVAVVIMGDLIAILCLHYFIALLFVRLITATFSAMLGIVAMSSANRRVDRGRAYGIYILGQCMTGVIGLALLPALFTHYGIRSYFILLPMLFIALSWLGLFLARGGTGTRPANDGHVSISSGFPVLLRRIAVLLFYMGLSGVWTFSGAISARAGINALHGGALMSGAAFAGVMGSALAAWYGRRPNINGAMFMGYGVLIGALLILMLPTMGAFIAGIVSFKFAWTFVIPFIFATIGQQDRKGEVIAEVNLLAGLGLSVAPWLAGQIVAFGNLPTLLLVECILLLVSAGSVYWMQIYARSNVPDMSMISENRGN